MRKIFNLLFLIVIQFCFSQNFVGKHVDLLIGKQVRVLPIKNELNQMYGYKGFFKDEKLGWNHFVGFLLLVLAVFFIFKKWN